MLLSVEQQKKEAAKNEKLNKFKKSNQPGPTAQIGSETKDVTTTGAKWGQAEDRQPASEAQPFKITGKVKIDSNLHVSKEDEELRQQKLKQLEESANQPALKQVSSKFGNSKINGEKSSLLTRAKGGQPVTEAEPARQVKEEFKPVKEERKPVQQNAKIQPVKDSAKVQPAKEETKVQLVKEETKPEAPKKTNKEVKAKSKTQKAPQPVKQDAKTQVIKINRISKWSDE